MKLADLAGLSVGAVAVLAVLMWAAYFLLGRRAGINRRHLRRVEAQNNLRQDALYEIDMAAAEYSDLDHPLASKVKEIIQKSRKDMRQL
jgi:hypothetical protein